MLTRPTPTTSHVQSLLALPAIGGAGVERSIVFTQLPEQAQSAIHAAGTEQAKHALAMAAGDSLPVIAQMYEHYIAAPARRSAQGAAFPTLASWDDFPLPGVLREADRAWLRPMHAIRAIEAEQEPGGWVVRVGYADGQERLAGCCTTLEQAQQLLAHVRQAAHILGLHTAQT